MHDLLLLGAGLGFTAAIQPGPTQAFLVSHLELVGTVSFLGSRVQRGLVGASAAVLAAIGVVLLVLGARGLL